jgi:hypothetical protein
LFDVALHFHFFNAANNSGFFDMGTLLNNTIVSERPMNAVTFVDNHDTQPGQGLSSFVAGGSSRWLMRSSFCGRMDCHVFSMATCSAFHMTMSQPLKG